jgi:glycosyltransferase involved in cell wall biosynthesis
VERQAPLLKAALESLKPDRGRVPFRRPPEPFPATRPVTVVMPVHDAPELTRDAIAAVLPELNASKRLILIDDGSRLPETVHLLADTVRRNDFVRVFAPSPQGALGFVAAANFGMREAQADDVILLNSDTRVSPGFIDRLRATAYSHPRYGTVTAVSNNGSIASVPYLSDSVELCRRETGAVIAPTAVGHCMYIRREVLDEFGALDSVFGKGYGEENDLSQRIRAKYDNVIDSGCYVWHKGSASFAAAEKRALNDKNLQIVHQRYPHYPFEVFAFQSSDPLRPVRKRMLRATRDPRRRVLNICHSYGVAAGTEMHVRDLALGLSDTTLSFIAAPDGHGREGLHLYQGETHLGTHPYLPVPWPIAPSTMPLMESTWTDVIDEVRPGVIHLHHLLNHPLGLIEYLVNSGIPVVVSVHDHFFLCPDYTLLGCPATDRCQDCFVKKFGAGHADYQIYRRRIFDGVLRKAAVITPSEDTSRRLREVYPGLTWRPTAEHPLSWWPRITRVLSPISAFRSLRQCRAGWHVPMGPARAWASMGPLPAARH